MHLAIVVLPDPLSPTSERVSFWYSSKETLSTALVVRLCLPRNPNSLENVTLRFSTFSNGSELPETALAFSCTCDKLSTSLPQPASAAASPSCNARIHTCTCSGICSPSPQSACSSLSTPAKI